MQSGGVQSDGARRLTDWACGRGLPGGTVGGMSLPPEKFAVAYHEAGHAIVAHELDLYVESIDLIPIPMRGGIAEGGADVWPKGDSEEYIITLFAGRAAQLVYAPDDDARAAEGFGDDQETIDGIAHRMGLSAERLGALAQRANDIVTTRWQSIEALVKELDALDQPKLDDFLSKPKLPAVLQAITGKAVADLRPRDDSDPDAIDAPITMTVARREAREAREAAQAVQRAARARVKKPDA